MENVCWVKININDLYINFDRTCEDHAFLTMTQVATSNDSQREENGKCLLGEKNINDFYVIFGAPARITLLPQGPKLGPQVTAKGTKIKTSAG